jgi:SAM-dependent methyltransferase
MSSRNVLDYFANKAAKYDLVDTQPYWVLSDALLWESLVEKVLNQLPVTFSFLDAGGGTGRWTKKILDNYSLSQGKLVDLSPDMLEQARRKHLAPQYNGRVLIEQGNIENMRTVTDCSFDLAFNFHNVLGFVQNPAQALSELVRSVKPGGVIVSVIPNIYHLVYFNIHIGRIEEAEFALQNNKGRFTNDMPYMHLFSPASIADSYKELGLSSEIIGFPVSIYPGYQETQISGSTERLANLLECPERFARLLEIEKALISSNVAARGNNLMAIGWKA